MKSVEIKSVGDEEALWSRWLEWVNRVSGWYPDWEIFESPNAKIDLNRIQRWINERHTHHGESCNDRYSSALA
jgi:hypothetical protein